MHAQTVTYDASPAAGAAAMCANNTRKFFQLLRRIDSASELDTWTTALLYLNQSDTQIVTVPTNSLLAQIVEAFDLCQPIEELDVVQLGAYMQVLYHTVHCTSTACRCCVCCFMHRLYAWAVLCCVHDAQLLTLKASICRAEHEWQWFERQQLADSTEIGNSSPCRYQQARLLDFELMHS